MTIEKPLAACDDLPIVNQQRDGRDKRFGLLADRIDDCRLTIDD
jgi:hypothetical protein